MKNKNNSNIEREECTKAEITIGGQTIPIRLCKDHEGSIKIENSYELLEFAIEEARKFEKEDKEGF